MIRKAIMEDMEQLKIVYHNARQYMKQTGNPTQWGDTNPAIERLEKDIEIGQLYVCHEGEEIYGAFVLQFTASAPAAPIRVSLMRPSAGARCRSTTCALIPIPTTRPCSTSAQAAVLSNAERSPSPATAAIALFIIG